MRLANVKAAPWWPEWLSPGGWVNQRLIALRGVPNLAAETVGKEYAAVAASGGRTERGRGWR